MLASVVSVSSVVIPQNQLLNYAEQVRDLRDDAAHRRRIWPRDRLVQLRDAEALDDLLLRLRVTDRAAVVLDRDVTARRVFFFLCHDLKVQQTFQSVDGQTGKADLHQFLDLFPAKTGDFHRVLHAHQPVKGRADDIVVIARSEDLRADVMHAQSL